MTATTSNLIKLLSIKGIGQRTARQLIPPSNISSDNELVEFLLGQNSKTPRLKLTKIIIKSGIEKATRIMSKSSDLGISFIDFNSPKYPELLRAITNAPLVLSYRGEVGILNNKCVAVIGTRNPSYMGLKSAYNLGGYLAEIGAIVVSGLARGIDSSAHLGCLAMKGKTIAVLGNGLDTVYPSENKTLANRILDDGGLIITESFVKEKASAGSLLLRNQLLVGLSTHVIVVETGVKGGTIYTANLGIKAGRKIACLAYHNNDNIGNIKLLKNPKVTALHNYKSLAQFLKA